MITLLLSLLACGPAPPPAPAPESVEVLLDFGPLYGGLSSGSVVDRRLVEPGLLHRVRLEGGALGLFREDTAVEGWTRRVLLGGLGSLGSTVIGPDWPAPHAAEEAVVDEASAWLRELRFVAGREPVAVVLSPSDESGRHAVSIRLSDDERSLCPPDLSLEVDYVELHAVLQRARDRAVVAVWQEVAVVDAEADLVVRASLPDPAIWPALACEAVTRLHTAEVQPRLGGADFDRTAEQLLGLALSSLTREGVDLEALVAPAEAAAKEP